MKTRDEHAQLRQRYADAQSAPTFALALALRQQLSPEEMRAHFVEWRTRVDSSLTSEDHKTIDNGGSSLGQIQEQHELALILELCGLYASAAEDMTRTIHERLAPRRATAPQPTAPQPTASQPTADDRTERLAARLATPRATAPQPTAPQPTKGGGR